MCDGVKGVEWILYHRGAERLLRPGGGFPDVDAGTEEAADASGGGAVSGKQEMGGRGGAAVACNKGALWSGWTFQTLRL